MASFLNPLQCWDGRFAEAGSPLAKPLLGTVA
jgi:hypothetical protein